MKSWSLDLLLRAGELLAAAGAGSVDLHGQGGADLLHPGVAPGRGHGSLVHHPHAGHRHAGRHAPLVLTTRGVTRACTPGKLHVLGHNLGQRLGNINRG